MKTKRLDFARIFVLVVFGITAVFYMIWIPPGEGVDELAHFDYIRFVKEQHTLPVQPTKSGEPRPVAMGHHPPLYYVLNAVMLTGQNTMPTEQTFRMNPHFEWAENNGRNGWNVMVHAGQDVFPGVGAVRSLYVVRLFGIVYGLITLFAIYQAAKIAFPTITWLPLLATSVIAFNPSFIFMSSTIHHDILLVMWFALGTWWMMHYWQQRTPRHAYLAGILVGCAMLTKISGVVLGAGVAVMIILTAIRERKPNIVWRDGVISGGMAALIAGGWFIRNRVLYGDFLGWNAYSYVFHFNLRPEPSVYLGVTDFFRQAGRNFWGGFGFMHITFPEISRYFWMGTAVILIGWLVLLLRNRAFFKQHAAPLMGGFSILVGILAVYLRFSTVNLGAGHGRYLFPAAFAIGILIAIGVYGLIGQTLFKWAAVAISLGMLVYAYWLPLVHVLPKYKPIETRDTLPPTATIINQQLSQGVTILGYQINTPQPLSAGTGLETILYWQVAANENNISDPVLEITLETPSGEILSAHQGWPTPSTPPDSWPQDKIVVTYENLYVPEKELPGKLNLMAKAVGNSDAAPVLITELQTVGGAARIETQQLPSDLDLLFGDELSLRGYQLSTNTFQPGEIIYITLFWQVQASPSADHTLFVHVIDASGQLVAQLDRPAGGPQTPTSTWQQGEAWRDAYPVQLPEQLPDGSYSLRIGMYDWPSLERLSISDSQEDTWLLGTIEVVAENEPE